MKLQHSLKAGLIKGEPFWGPGMDELMRNVEQKGSLQLAADEMNMSYSKAWKSVRRAERVLGFQLLKRQVGGAGGGSSVLTDQGKIFVERYHLFSQELGQLSDQVFEKHFEDLYN